MKDRLLMLDLADACMEEHAAWVARNVARNALRLFQKGYRDDTGAPFDRDTHARSSEPEDAAEVAQFDALTIAVKAAQRKLTTKRAATRRAAVRVSLMQREEPK